MYRSLINVIDEVKLFFSSLDILYDTKNIKPKIIFFSENKVYQKFTKPLIDIVCSVYPSEVYYLSIDKEDKIDNNRVINYFVNPLLINFIFKKLKAENIFLTVTDLGNNLLKKTKNIDKYIYYFHSPVSTTKNYTSAAFDNYDIMMCNGKYQIDEIRSREHLKKLTKKKLIPSGYFYFDYLINNVNDRINNDEILVAPSWNKNLPNSINENFIDLINILIKKKYKVTFRPHPEHLKRSIKILDFIKRKFRDKSFNFDINDDNINSMQKAKCLITDSSGIAIEYMIAIKRPVLYLNEHDKIHNSDFKDFSKFQTIDQKIKDNFGYIFENKDFDNIDYIIKNSEINLKKKLPKLKNFIDDNFFNFGNTKKFLIANIKEII